VPVLFISKAGLVDAERIKIRIFPAIERGQMDRVNGIVVHQTDSTTAESTFSSYKIKGANGAHFLIDKNGDVYQTASLMKRTNHVGKLKSRCLVMRACSPVDLKIASSMQYQYTKLSIHEHKKKWPGRYPSNSDSIGIELVGKAYRAEASDPKGVDYLYEDVTNQQNSSLKWLMAELMDTLNVPAGEIYRHPQISYKQRTEASTAKW
jgi:N-acetyl-anhydromuramyl-L-alanine amidase AmpD